MEVTWVCLIIIPITILLLFSHKPLSRALKLTIFFLPFGAISVANFHNIPPYFGIGLDRYFAVILIFLYFTSLSLTKFKVPRFPPEIRHLFLFFLGAIIVSFIVPLYFNLTIWEHSADPISTFYEVPLRFTNRNISKLVEFLILSLFFVSVYGAIPLIPSSKIARIWVLSLLIMAASGFFDFFSAIPIVWNVVKNNISYSHAMGIIYDFFGMPRICGLSPEPSHFIMYSLMGTAMICAFYKNSIKLFSKRIDFFILILFITAGIFSFSPTILVGCLIISIYLIWRINLIFLKRLILFIFFFFSVSFIAYEEIANLFEVLIGSALGKMGITWEYGIYSTYRLDSIKAVMEAFLESPLIGVGWGSLNHQVGFPLFLLGSVGIFGTLIFLYLIISIFTLSRKKIIYSGSKEERVLREGFILSFLIITVMCVYTKAYLYFLHLPTIFLAASTIAEYEQGKRLQN